MLLLGFNHFVTCTIIAERLSARQLILHRISRRLCVSVCRFVRFRNFIKLRACAKRLRPTKLTDVCRLLANYIESRYAPETRDHVVRVRMRGGALTLALYSRCPRYFDLKIINIILCTS